MSWTSRLGGLGRFSPFTRSGHGSTKVSDSDFSYITADDLRKHQEETIQDQQHRQGLSESPVDYGPPRDTDVLILRNKKGREFTVHFAAYSIPKGELTIKEVREKAAEKAHTDFKRVKLVYKGKNLKDDSRTCKQEGIREGSEILLSIYEQHDDAASSSDSGDDEVDDAQGGTGEDGQRRRRNRGKKSKRKNRREATREAESGTSTPDHRNNSNLGVPLSQRSTNTGSRTGSRAASPKPPPTPATPLDKLNALQQTLSSFKSDVDYFLRHPPEEQSKREFEHKKLSEMILTQVLLKLDAVETEGDADARQRRKDLVKETQGVLNELDAAMKK